ncbi:DEAD/DEAH box helicase family protein [Campylobacter sp. VTCC 70190]|uniref:DEAD/DEAH box helicase family protein n=1 Tax=Campylobacter sp. VTCC 70190 TaxID=3392118 RepID=UPI00398E5CD1
MVKKEKGLFELEETRQILLQGLAENSKIELNELDEYDLDSFSDKKTLLEYQKEALENAFSILNLFFNECSGDKDKFYALLGVKNSLDIRVGKDSLLREYFQISSSNRLEFKQIVNQMCFWMATGSGKTIVIIKLIEMLRQAMDNDLIPKKNIFFFSASDDLLEAFKKEVEEYNQGNIRIICHSLKEFEKVKGENNGNLFKQTDKPTDVFIYGAYNLISDESKEKQIKFTEVLDNGDNYVILDEAHKGDKSYSKMQHIMNILSKNGFLFNFSATFTSAQDIAMTVLNLNVIEWIQKGYGKKPLLLKDSDLSAFREKQDFNENAKQKAILKSLIALYLCKNSKINSQKDSYHDPMMLIFCNSVTAQNSDAHIFFKTLQSIVSNDCKELFEEAKEEIADELKKSDYLIPTEDNDSLEFLSAKVLKLELNEIKKQVFYSHKGNLEAIYYPSNSHEILFKLDSVEKPFMLIRIGNIIEWLRINLKGIKISKSHKDLEAFKNIDKSSITILLGSRMFSEGWNTTRPNVVLFLNIGIDKEAKTFVTQSLGRTFRIKSYEGNTKRANFIENSKVEANRVLETSFILATNSNAIEQIIENTQVKNIPKKTLIKLEKNPLADGKNLLIPKYKHTEEESNKIKQKSKIRVSKQNKEMAQIYANISHALMALRHNISDKNKIELVKKLLDESNFYESNDKHYKNISVLVKEVEKRSIVKVEALDKFERLKDEIKHFEKICVNTLKSTEVAREIHKINADKKEDKSKVTNARYKYLEKHYYNPLICEKDSVDFSHIVKIESEIEFLKELDSLNDKIDEKVKWWFFSKIEEKDEIYIPYIKDAKDRRFYPDFIFWIKKLDGSLKIAFIDPKGTKNTDYEFKCDGFNKVFETNDNKKLEVKLYLIKNNAEISQGYASYWLDLKGNGKEGLLEIFS